MKNYTIGLPDDNFEAILICAERYACGRQTYMPSIVVSFIKPLIPNLSEKFLAVLKNDLNSAWSYGDKRIDEPLWIDLLREAEDEINRRSQNAKKES